MATRSQPERAQVRERRLLGARTRVSGGCVLVDPSDSLLLKRHADLGGIASRTCAGPDMGEQPGGWRAHHQASVQLWIRIGPVEQKDLSSPPPKQ